MREIRTSGSMSGDEKRSVAAWPKLPRSSSTLPQPRCAEVQQVVGYWKCCGPSAPLGRTAAHDLGCAKTKSDLVLMPSGRQVFAFFCSAPDHRPQNSGCSHTAQRFHTAWTHSEPAAPLRKRMRLTRSSRPTRRTVSLQSVGNLWAPKASDIEGPTDLDWVGLCFETEKSRCALNS
jgi:hypothetical protein